MSNNLKSDIIEDMFSSIIPNNCIGEQYTEDVALIFNPIQHLVAKKNKISKG